jgi:hypothetical protein
MSTICVILAGVFAAEVKYRAMLHSLLHPLVLQTFSPAAIFVTYMQSMTLFLAQKIHPTQLILSTIAETEGETGGVQ